MCSGIINGRSCVIGRQSVRDGVGISTARSYCPPGRSSTPCIGRLSAGDSIGDIRTFSDTDRVCYPCYTTTGDGCTGIAHCCSSAGISDRTGDVIGSRSRSRNSGAIATRRYDIGIASGT